jgi:hypothetical protein
MIDAGEMIDEMLRESERIVYLNPDDTDAALLEGKLHLIMTS